VHQNAKRRHLLFSQASTDKDEGAIRKDRAFLHSPSYCIVPILPKIAVIHIG
jgi:hypothetical protein